MSKYPFPYSKAAELDPRIDIPRPIIDPLQVPLLDFDTIPEELDLNLMRGLSATEYDNTFVYNADTIIQDKPHLNHTEYSISGPDNNTIILSIFIPKDPISGTLPALYHIHGGGMISGDRFTAITQLVDLLQGINCIIVSVEYRLAPETRAPGAAKDCFAGLVWTYENAARLGIDPENIVVYGVSGGGALAASMCFMARDKNTPAIPIKGLMLHTPMLDDRCESLSDQQFEQGSPWSGVWNRKAWECVLGEDRGTDNVTPYQVPSRATDLSNLPSTYIDVGECEVFRDPAVKFAIDMWRCGSTCELHVWPGAFHGFDFMDNLDIPIVHAAVEAKRSWLRRMMSTGT